MLALSLMFGVFLLLGALVFSGGYVHALLAQRGYQAAPVCGQSVVTQPCRLRSDATVTGGHKESGKNSSTYWVDVTLPTGGTYVGSLDRLVWESLSLGQPVQVEIWEGDVSVLNGVETDSNPNWDVGYARSLALGFWVSVFVVLALAAISFFMWRRRDGAIAAAA